MIAINVQLIENIFIKDKIKINSIIDSKKASVQEFFNNPTRIVNRIPIQVNLTNAHLNYLQLLLTNFDNIVKANSTSLAQYKGLFDQIISAPQMISKSNEEFRNELLKRMGYSGVRDNYYPEYFEQLGIKSCVYCNSQFAITVRNVKGQKVAKFQVDHYFPKREYPSFSISFYNLYPVCGPCNNSKSFNNVNFNLYSDNYSDYKSSKFQFELDKKSLVKYRVNGTNAVLKINFIDVVNSRFNETFAIESIYNTQKDIAEELVIKSMIYNKTYTEVLKDSLTKLYKDKEPILARLLVGNYTDEKDIHKRPMAKFTMDIARQLKLII